MWLLELLESDGSRVNCGAATEKCMIAFKQVLAFVAPKIIGGVTAPTPVGELGMVEMTQALNLVDVSFEQVSYAALLSLSHGLFLEYSSIQLQLSDEGHLS